MSAAESLASEKAELRHKALVRRREAAEANPAASQRLAQHAGAVQVGAVVSGYIAMRDELDPMPLMEALASRGATLALPALVDGVMEFRRYRPGDPLTAGPFGTREPAASAEPVTPDTLLVPLLAFDRTGVRLGYGAGHYDRYLAAHAKARAVGIAYAAQEVPALPREPHDVPLSAILTEAGLIETTTP